MATLSLQLSLFFEGWVKRLAESGDRQDLVYAVYAGGDDVFLIGPWDCMPDLAVDIQRDFKSYSAENPDVHLSGGMAFIGGKYPIYQAAEDAGEAEAAAKAQPGKDSFCFLDQALKWSTFHEVDQMRGELEELVHAQGGGAARSLLQILMSLDKQASEMRRDHGATVWGPWMWRGAYSLTRMAERARDPDLASAILRIRDRLDEEDYGRIGLWGLAARWAQLATREGNAVGE